MASRVCTLLICNSILGPSNIFSESIKGIDVKVKPAGLMMMPSAESIASCTLSTSTPSKLVCRNSNLRPNVFACVLQRFLTSARDSVP